MTGARYTYRRYIDDSFADRMRDKPAADRWCVHALLGTGQIAPSHHSAAVRLSYLIERSKGQGGSGAGERVDGGGADPHARQWDAQRCKTVADNADTAVTFALAARQWNTPNQARRRERCIKAFRQAVAFPHVSVAVAQQKAGFGYGGRGHGDFAAALAEALDHLVTFFDAYDADEAARKKALAASGKSLEGF